MLMGACETLGDSRTQLVAMPTRLLLLHSQLNGCLGTCVQDHRPPVRGQRKEASFPIPSPPAVAPAPPLPLAARDPGLRVTPPGSRRVVAFAMGCHDRLGQSSPLSILNDECMRACVNG